MGRKVKGACEGAKYGTGSLASSLKLEERKKALL